MSDVPGFYEQTPSQAEGEREDDEVVERNKMASAPRGRTAPERAIPRTTPSQAEGERDEPG